MHTTKHGAGFVHSAYPRHGAPTHRAQAPTGETLGKFRTLGAARAAVTRATKRAQVQA
jgi:hypothetical protein